MLGPWKKSHDKPKQHIKKQRHYFANKYPHGQSYGKSRQHIKKHRHHFADKGPYSQIYVRLHQLSCTDVNWTIKKAECQRIDAFKLPCRRRHLRVPWKARRSNLSILKEINPEYSLEGLMLKLKLQYFGHLMQRANSLEKTLMLGKIKGRRRGQQRMRWLDGITDSMDMNLGKLRERWGTGRPGVLQSMGSQWVRHDLATNNSNHTLLTHRIASLPRSFQFIFEHFWWWGAHYLPRKPIGQL